MTTPTPEERAREIAERHPWICSDQGHKSSADALLKDIAQALLTTRNETIEECAQVVEDHGAQTDTERKALRLEGGVRWAWHKEIGRIATAIRNLRKGG